MNIIQVIQGFLIFVAAHFVTWFQLNGQFKWDWFKDNEWVVAACGFILSFFYIWGTKYTVQGVEGLLWPSRFIGFGIGMVIYALGVSYFFGEGITTKTAISLGLCLILICIQVFWK